MKKKKNKFVRKVAKMVAENIAIAADQWALDQLNKKIEEKI